MSGIPSEVRALLDAREGARAAKDFARADALRDEILAAGYVLKDTPEGAVIERAQTFERFDPARIPNTLDQPTTLEFSVHVLYEGFPADVERFLAGLRKHNDLSSAEVVIVDNASSDGDWLDTQPARILRLDREVGWAAARNAGLKTSRGRFIALVDLSIEPEGDILTPLARALADPAVGLAGPFGLVSADMRSWTESDGPEVDALEGYLLATRRETLAKELICEKFKWYRNADIDLSFQIRSYGLRAIVVSVPVRKHAHRGWEALSEEERAKRSKRNHYIFFDRWKQHHNMLLSHRDP